MKEKLTIFGSGVGFPNLEPGKEIRYPPGYLLERGGLQLLIEVSPLLEFRLASTGIDYSDIKTFCISHFHPDHFGGLFNFVFFSRVRSYFKGKLPNKIRIIGPEGLQERFTLMKDAHATKGIDQLEGLEIKFTELSGDGSEIKLEKDIALNAFSTFHESKETPALALRIEFPEGFVFSYSGDSGLTEGLRKATQNADLFLCEASADIGQDKSGYGHMNPGDVGKLAKESNVKRLLLTHYSGKDPEENVIRAVKEAGFEGEVALVKDFQQIQLR